jgi:hypothetical protein
MFAMKSIKQYNLGGCSICIRDGIDLRGTSSRLSQVALYKYQVSSNVAGSTFSRATRLSGKLIKDDSL